MFSRLIPSKTTKQTPVAEKKNTATRIPYVSVKENDQNYSLDVSMPGVAPDQAQVTVKDGVLTIQGNVVEQSSDMELAHIEYTALDFLRSFSLPKDVNTDDIQATSKHGVLHVVLPKVTAAQPRKIAVSAS